MVIFPDTVAVCCFQLIIPATVKNHSQKHVRLLEYTGIVQWDSYIFKECLAVITCIVKTFIEFNKKDKIEYIKFSNYMY